MKGVYHALVHATPKLRYAVVRVLVTDNLGGVHIVHVPMVRQFVGSLNELVDKRCDMLFPTKGRIP